jgi:hypothetical protein
MNVLYYILLITIFLLTAIGAVLSVWAGLIKENITALEQNAYSNVNELQRLSIIYSEMQKKAILLFIITVVILIVFLTIY